MFGKEGPGTYYTQMSAIFVILCTLVPQTLQNIVLRRGCFPGHFLIYGKPIKSCIVLVIVYMIHTEAYLEPCRISRMEPF